MSFIVYAALFYVLGIITASQFSIPVKTAFELLLINISLSLLAALLNHKRNYIFILIGFFLIGILLTTASQEKIKYNPLIFLENKTVVLNGQICNEPETKDNLICFYFKVSNINNLVQFKTKPLVKVQIKTKEKQPSLAYGDIVKIKGKISPIEPVRFKGQFNYKQYLARQNIKEIILVENISEITKTGLNEANLFLKTIFCLKRRFINISRNILPYPESSLLSGIVLGEYSICPENLKRAFISTGTLHILAASGLNVAVLIFFCLGAGRFIKTNEKLNCLTAIILVIIYTFIAGAEPSIARAGIMGIFSLLAVILNRKKEILHFLFLSALITLIYKPLWLFEIGFQLSYLSVLGIFYLTPIFESKLSKLPKFIRLPLSVSISAQISLCPIMAYYFNQFSIIGVFANLIIVPLAELLLPLGLLEIVAGVIYFPLSYLLAPVSWLLTFLIYRLTLWMDKFPFAMVYASKPTIWFLLAYYLFIGAWIYQFKQIKSKNFFFKYITTLIVLAGFIVCIFYQIIKPCPLVVNFIYVNKGDAIFIKLPTNHCILIDSGPLLFKNNKNEFAEEKIITPFLKQQGVNTLDLIIISHLHSDHIGGLLSILRDFKVKKIISPPQDSDSDTWGQLKNLIVQKRIPFERAAAGNCINFTSNLTLEILSPRKDCFVDNPDNFNNGSLVTKLKYKEVSFLFAGDIEKDAEKILLHSNCNLKADILKIAHQGSVSSSSYQFLKKVNPKYAVIFAEKNNIFGHPSKKVLQNLAINKTKTFITSKNGTITFITDGETISAKTLYP